MNMRPFLKHAPTFEEGCNLTLLPVTGKATLDTTLADFMKSTRNNFEDRLKRGHQYGALANSLKPIDYTKIKAIPGGALSVTNVGQLKLGGPFDDVAMNVTTGAAEGSPNMTFLHYAVIDGDKNEGIHAALYSAADTSKREADMLMSSVIYGLENIELSDSMGVAIEKMQEFQSNFIKKEYPKYLAQ